MHGGRVISIEFWKLNSDHSRFVLACTLEGYKFPWRIIITIEEIKVWFNDMMMFFIPFKKHYGYFLICLVFSSALLCSACFPSYGILSVLLEKFFCYLISVIISKVTMIYYLPALLKKKKGWSIHYLPLILVCIWFHGQWKNYSYSTRKKIETMASKWYIAFRSGRIWFHNIVKSFGYLSFYLLSVWLSQKFIIIYFPSYSWAKSHVIIFEKENRNVHFVISLWNI